MMDKKSMKQLKQPKQIIDTILSHRRDTILSDMRQKKQCTCVK